MKRTRIRQISNKQRLEIKKRQELKADLIAEYGERCMTCNDLYRDWRGISLSHIIPLGRGGKTERGNVELLCGHCHSQAHNIKETNKE